MKKTLLLGIGTGRCGTLSLTYLLNRQPECSVSHEMRPLPVWDGEDTNVILDKFKSIMTYAEEPICGDIAFYHLNYLETIFQWYDNVKVIVLQRDKEETIRSFIAKMKEWPGILPVNHFSSLNRSRYAYTPFDNCFPKYAMESSKECIAQYYDDYYLKAKQLQNKYPNSFCWLYVNSFFQSPRQIHQLCDWVGIPKSNRYTDYICAINRKG